MAKYWLDLFTPETWEEAEKNKFKLSGFRENRWHLTQQIKTGDFLVCYITGEMRFSGILKVISKPYFSPEASKKVWRGADREDVAKDIWSNIENNIESAKGPLNVSKFIRYFWLSRYSFVSEKNFIKK